MYDALDRLTYDALGDRRVMRWIIRRVMRRVDRRHTYTHTLLGRLTYDVLSKPKCGGLGRPTCDTLTANWVHLIFVKH